jgi:hypothetical protein
MTVIEMLEASPVRAGLRMGDRAPDSTGWSARIASATGSGDSLTRQRSC